MAAVAERPATDADGDVHFAGRVHVTWHSVKSGNQGPAVFAHLEVTDADTGEPLTAVTGITIRCAAGEHDGTASVELTELVDSLGRPVRRGRTWDGTDRTLTSTYLLATEERPERPVDFGQALTELRAGRRVARTGWNGPGQWLVLVPGSTIIVEAGRPLGQAAPELTGRQVSYAPHIDIHTTDGRIAPWVASQTDALAYDWHVVRTDPDGQA